MFSYWSTAPVVLVALLATGCSIQADGYGADGSFDRTVRVTGPADVSVSSRSGSIRVAPGASDQIHIAARIRAFGSSASEASEQVRQLESAPPIRQEGNSVSIGDIGDPMLRSNVSISYEITVPPGARVRTWSRSGAQTIVSLSGPLDAVSRSGNIRLDNVRGPLRLGSRSGHVTVDGEPSGKWEIETRSGDVTLRVPSTASFDVAVATRSGSIRTSRAIEATGELRRREFRGKVQGGGPPVNIGTRSGSISIE